MSLQLSQNVSVPSTSGSGHEGDTGKGHSVSLVHGGWVGKVGDLARETCEMLETRVGDTETETEIQSHRQTGMGRETGPESRRQGGSSLASPSTQNLGPILYSDPSPSLSAVPVAMVTGRPNMQQRRLGLQTWPVSMETGEGGRATSSKPGSWPPDSSPRLYPLPEGGREDLPACPFPVPTP